MKNLIFARRYPRFWLKKRGKFTYLNGTDTSLFDFAQGRLRSQWLPPVAEESRKCRLTYQQIYYNSIAMIESKTVFILGAGASCPYGYPSGIELRSNIISSFWSQYEHYINKQPKLQPSLDDILNKAREFMDIFEKSTTESIDLFLARNHEFEILGKTAIIIMIIAKEKDCAFRERMATDKRKQDWYSYIFRRLTDELVEKSDYCRFCENNVSFITFNYDRSLEHFLYESLVNSFYKIPTKKIKEQLIKLKIIHVFGQVAGLEWQDLPDKIEYRKNVNQIDIQGLVKNIRTIYEEEENPELEEARELIREAQHIFFLGFGYAKENLDLLKLPQILKRGVKVYGTAYGLTPNEILKIKNNFRPILDTDLKYIHIEEMDSLMLLRQFL